MNIAWFKMERVMTELGALLNLDNALGQITAPQQRKMAVAINAALRHAWRFYPWPGTVWYARGLSNTGLTGVPDEEWSLLHELGYEVLCAYTEDPVAAWEAGNKPKLREVVERHGREVVLPTTDTVFYAVRLAPPELGFNTWSDATGYVTGDLTYDTATGEAWRCVRPHTDEEPDAVWVEWELGRNYEEQFVRRGGVLYTLEGTNTSTATDEPNFGEDWDTVWTPVPRAWAPQRVPQFLLGAVLAGARVYMDTMDSAGMESAMQGALESEASQISRQRQQGAAGGGVMILP
jgi:hypothetical protein